MRYLLATLLAVLTLASPAFASQVTNVTVDNSAPTRATAARTVYLVDFTTTNALASGNSVTVGFPIGTGFGGWAGGTISVGATEVGGCSNAGNSTIVCSLYSGRAIAASTAVRLTLNGITNAGNTTQARVTVSTTTDADAANSAFFTIALAGRLTQIENAIASPSAAAGARTKYVTTFVTSATGGMSADANTRINIAFPPLTGYLGWAGGTVHDVTRGVDVGACSNPSNAVVQCSLYSGQFTNAGDTIRVTLEGITNPDAGTDKVVRVDTTSDWASLPSAPYTVVPAGELSAVTLANGAPSNAAGARTRYIATFTLSATGGLSDDGNSRIDLTFPPGTTFTGWAGGTVRVAGGDVGACSSPSGLGIQCSLYSGRTVPGGAEVTITFDGVTNPLTPGADKRVTVSTTSDPGAVSSAPFTVVPAGPLSAVTAVNAAPSAAAGARTRYLVAFTVSATGGLSDGANSRLDVTFPAGTTFTGWSGGTVSVGPNEVGACSSPSGLAIQCSLYSDRSVAAGADVTIAFDGVTNSATPGANKTVTVSTTSDPQAVASAPFSVVAGGSLAGVSVAVGSLAPSARTNYVVRMTTSATGGLSDGANSRIAYRFPAGTTFAGWSGGSVSVGGTDVGGCSSPDGLEIECWLYSGRAVAAGTTVQTTFANVTNPPTPGPYRLTLATTSDTAGVASPDYGGSQDPEPTPTPTPTPFATASPGPTPTPTPTPTPMPEFKEDVVVAPVSGTIKVCPKGPNGACTTLPAGAAIPMGSTIDARKGVVELTSIAARGAAPQKARFYDGMFKVTQSATTTDLTLNEPLDCKGAKKAKSAAQKKKPKSRKLWGDGKGKFRTKGQYSAATIRGTKWLVQDTCTSTLTRVTQGVVSVRDEVKRKTITLRASKSYTAKPRSKR